ncbi:MAG: NAD-dependent epimerase/dehydratase family protein [Candidatus Heimdallarchaeota archaeon]|nr:NAD-dependent epimerase/dehydratase family protein [Candidatus Heimdallarchaeota archaeon]
MSFQATTWFVTGSTGLVGSSVVKKLRQDDFAVIALVRKNSPQHVVDWLLELDVKIVVGDILEKESYESYIATCDVVVHCAALVGSDSKKSNWEVNVEGTRVLLNVMKDFGIDRLIHISTCGIYGSTGDHTVDEDRTPKPVGQYSKSKYAAENLILNEFKNLSVTIFRPPYIIGDVKFDRRTIPGFVKVMGRRFIPKVLFKDPAISFVNAQDLASLVVLVGCRENTVHQIYNIQSFILRYSEIKAMLNRTFDKKTVLVPLPYFMLKGVAYLVDTLNFLFRKNALKLSTRIFRIKENWTFNTDRINAEFSWTPSHPEMEQFEIFLIDYKKNIGMMLPEVDIRTLIEV